MRREAPMKTRMAAALLLAFAATSASADHARGRSGGGHPGVRSGGGHSEWAVGLADDPTQSALRAVIACANRLLASA